MSLIDSRMEDAVMLDLVSVPDGFGGVLKEWRDGAPFRAAIQLKTTTDAEIAYQQGAKRLYTVYTRQIVRLDRGDRFRRVNDGRVLRKNLALCGKDEAWLKKTLSEQGIPSPAQVFLLTLDEKGSTCCVPREEAP